MRSLTNLKMNTTKSLKLNKRYVSINGILAPNVVQPLPHYPEKREREVTWKEELVEVRFYKPDASIKYFPTSNLKVRWKKDLVEVRYYAGYIDDITCDIDVEMVDCFDETSTNMDTSISQVDYHQKPRRRPITPSISQVNNHQKPRRRPITRSLSKRTRSGKLY